MEKLKKIWCQGKNYWQKKTRVWRILFCSIMSGLVVLVYLGLVLLTIKPAILTLARLRESIGGACHEECQLARFAWRQELINDLKSGDKSLERKMMEYFLDQEEDLEFIEELIKVYSSVYSEDNLPDYLKMSKGRNRYYLLPLLLGIAGLIYQYQKQNKDFWVVTLLFVLTGFAILVYLNQYPFQPRERDYAYAGSFYAFTIWIGLGVLWLIQLVSKKYYIDELYDFMFVKPSLWLSRFLHEVVELRFIDRIVNGVGQVVIWTGNTVRYVQTGNVGFYMFIMILGIILILFFNILI